METRERCDACDEALAGVAPLTVTSTRGDAIDYAGCPSCGLVQMASRPTAADMATFYDDAYYGHGDTKFSGGVEALRSICFRRRAKRVLPLIAGSPPAVLDVGAGDGRFLKAMHGLGCDIAGTELAGAAHDRAARIPGIELHAGEVTDAGFAAGRFNAVTLWHVLEHVSSPRVTLECCNRLLADDGVLVVEVPNLGSWQSRLTGRHAFHLDPPRHICQFDDRSLTALLAATGFDITRRETCSLEMGVLGVTQSLLNTFINPRDLFYDMLRTRNRCPGHPIAKAVSALITALLIPFGMLFTLIESACGHGPVLRLFCRKSPSA